MKIVKTIYNNKTKWETIKATLQNNNDVNTCLELGYLQKPPDNNWVPDPGNPEDNGWSNFNSYAVDILVEDTFDIMAAGLEMYLSPIPKELLKFMHRIPSTEDYPLEFKRPNLTWSKSELTAFCDAYMVNYSASWVKQQFVDAIEVAVILN